MRHSLVTDGSDSYMVEDGDGDWVPIEDYQDLQGQINSIRYHQSPTTRLVRRNPSGPACDRVRETWVPEIQQWLTEPAYLEWLLQHNYVDQHIKQCYQCDAKVHELSPRSRCVKCEWGRAEFNEKENDRLRSEGG
jgi:hypothetical protein